MIKKSLNDQGPISSEDVLLLYIRSGLSAKQMARLFSWSKSRFYAAIEWKGIPNSGWRRSQYYNALRIIEAAESEVLSKLDEVTDVTLSVATRLQLLSNNGSSGAPFHELIRESLRHQKTRVRAPKGDLYKNAQGWWGGSISN